MGYAAATIGKSCDQHATGRNAEIDVKVYHLIAGRGECPVQRATCCVSAGYDAFSRNKNCMTRSGRPSEVYRVDSVHLAQIRTTTFSFKFS